MITAANGGAPITVYAKRHYERTRRWRCLPVPKIDVWWTDAIHALGGQSKHGIVVTRSDEELRLRVIEQARFIYDCPEAAVVVWWSEADHAA